MERLTFFDNISQSLPIIRILGYRLRIVPTLTRPVVDSQHEVMCSDGASDSGTATLDCFDGGTGRCMLEHDPQFRKSGVQLEQVR